MRELTVLLDALDIKQIEDNRYRAKNFGSSIDVILSGQMLGQAIVAAQRTQPEKAVKTIHTIFARAGRASSDTQLEVDTMHNGRTFGSVSVTTRQGDRLIARSQVLLHASEPHLMFHADPTPEVLAPEMTSISEYGFAGCETGVIQGIDVDSAPADEVRPPKLDVWIRFKGAPADPTVSQCLLAFATERFVIGTSMLPHVGVGFSNPGIVTGVVSTTLTFHEPIDAGRWMLLAHEVPYAGRGRVYGRANIFKQDGGIIASFVQDCMVRLTTEQSSTSKGRDTPKAAATK
jgi:acyl-CoA thioesterase II